MDSVLICMTAGGAIRPVTSGQSFEDINYNPVWRKSDSKYSTTVQIAILKLALAWQMASSEDEKEDILNQANYIRDKFSSGIAGFADKGKSLTGALADEFSWFLGGDVDRDERDYWLTELRKFQSGTTINEKTALQTAALIASIGLPSPDDALKFISKKAAKNASSSLAPMRRANSTAI